MLIEPTARFLVLAVGLGVLRRVVSPVDAVLNATGAVVAGLVTARAIRTTNRDRVRTRSA